VKQPAIRGACFSSKISSTNSFMPGGADQSPFLIDHRT